MNQVARVFLVINLLLSAGFLMAAATFLHQTQDWKKQYGVKDAEFVTETGRLQADIQSRDAEVKRITEDLGSREKKINTLEGQLAEAQGLRNSAVEQKNQSDRNFQQLQQTANQSAQNVAELKDALKGLEAMIEKYRERAEGAIEAQRVAELASAASAEETADRDNTINDLNNSLEAVTKQLEDINTELTAYKGAYPPPALKDQPRIDGMVIRYDAETNMVQVNKGRMDGVALGHMFDVVHGNDYVGTVRITYLDDKTSVGHVHIKGLKGLMPVAGDKATKLASN